MLFRCFTILLLVFAGRGLGQTVTTLNLPTQARSPDFSNFPFTRPVTVGAALPMTCQVGQLFFNTTAAAGQNIFGCTQPNTWVACGLLRPASSSTLGGIIVPSNSGLLLSSDSGALSVAYGTGSFTALEGNTLGRPNGPASLDVNGRVPAVQLGNLGSAAFLSSSAFDAAGAASTAVAAIPHSSSTSTQAALITPGDWATFNGKQALLGFTPENSANKNAKSGYAGLDTNGLLPWIQLSGVPIAASSKAGILSATDWTTFNSKQAALGFTPENAASKGQVNGYASLNSSGQVPTTQLPTIPTKTSQLANDTGFVNNTQAAAAAPVQSVNGQTGAITISSGQYNQTVQVNGTSQIQRAKLNISSGSNVTLSAADSGTDTTTVTISSIGGGGGLPDPGSNGLVKRTATNADAIAVPGTDYYAPGTKIANSDLNSSLPVNITGNAQTATAFATAPTGCSGGQFIQQIGANGVPVTCGLASTGGPSITTGAAVPSSASCSSITKGSAYMQTGTVNNSGASRFWVCSNTGSSVNSGFNWIPITGQQVNVMSFGAKVDGVTDDQAAFQAAVNFAQSLNVYNGTHYGATVYVPCGKYAIASPIVLPRTGPNSALNGVVNLIGESKSCAILSATGTSTWGTLQKVVVSNTGSGYLSSPGVTFAAPVGGSCSTLPIATANVSGGIVTSISLTNAGKCAGAPTVSISGGGGTGATARSVMNDAVIQWDVESGFAYDFSTDTGKVVNQRIQDLSINSPQVQGTGSIHYRYAGEPAINQANGATAERMENFNLSNMILSGSNQYTPWDVYLEGDCNGCVIRNLNDESSRGSATNYDIVLLMTDVCTTNNLTNEACGIQFNGVVDGIVAGSIHGGFVAPFQGRLHSSTFSNAQCDGISGIAGNPYTAAYSVPGKTSTPGFGGSQCYAFINSFRSSVSQIENEGRGENVQVLVGNDHLMDFTLIGLSTPNSAGFGVGNGMNVTQSDQCRFSVSDASGSFTAQGVKMIQVDSTSRNNVFLNIQSNGASDLSMANLDTNFVQWCDSSAGPCASGAWQTLGYHPGYQSVGTGPQPNCNLNTKGAIWPIPGLTPHAQMCNYPSAGWVNIF